jgi:hypothetical protein
MQPARRSTEGWTGAENVNVICPRRRTTIEAPVSSPLILDTLVRTALIIRAGQCAGLIAFDLGRVSAPFAELFSAMARLARSSVLIALLPIAFCRLRYDIRPTQTNYAADQFDFEWGWSPVPTAMPNVFDKLSRRQGIAPNSTCGFISGCRLRVLPGFDIFTNIA